MNTITLKSEPLPRTKHTARVDVVDWFLRHTNKLHFISSGNKLLHKLKWTTFSPNLKKMLMECVERTPHCVNNTQTCTKMHSALQEFPVHPKSQTKQQKCFFLMECSFLPFFCFLLQNSNLDYCNSQEWATLKVLFNFFEERNNAPLQACCNRAGHMPSCMERNSSFSFSLCLCSPTKTTTKLNHKKTGTELQAC